MYEVQQCTLCYLNEMSLHHNNNELLSIADMDEIEEIQQLTQFLGVEQATGDANENDSSSDEENDGDKDCGQNTLYPEKFVVVGSWQEQRYQQALAIIMYRRSKNLKLEFKVEHEPDNVRDSNALKFLVLHNENWYIIGYCGLNKIPKLKRALHRDEVHSISLDSLKRSYAFMEKKLLYHASLFIVKHGLWDKDEPNNKYNSQIDC